MVSELPIRAFLRGLPHTLVQPMEREFEAKHRDLERWAEKSRSLRLRPYLERRSDIEFLMALGIYYRYVLAPLAGASDFIGRITGDTDGAVRVAGRRLDKQFQRSIQRAHAAFSAVVMAYGMPPAFFAETDVRRIVMSLVELEERRAREQE